MPTMSASASPTKRARCITAISNIARSTARPRRTRRARLSTKASKSPRSRCCRTIGIDRGRMSPNTFPSWLVWAVLSASFAALTADRNLRQDRRRGHQFRSRDPDPHRRRAAQPGADPVCDRSVQPDRTDLDQELDLPRAVGPRHRRVLDLLFPRAETRSGHAGGTDRQIKRGAGGAVRRGVSRRTAIAQWLAWYRADRHGRGVDRFQAVATVRTRAAYATPSAMPDRDNPSRVRAMRTSRSPA